MKKSVLLLALLSIFAASQVFAQLAVTQTNDANTLVSEILGSGITLVGSPTYTGAAVASGTFTGGISAGVGFDKGIILTSGDAALAPGPNNSDGSTRNNGLPGNALLNGLIPGYSTNDATLLSFQFKTSSSNLFFNYVFASEEYNEYVNSNFNDVFGFFLGEVGGTPANIALIPGTSTPVSINNVNGGNPLGTGASNSAFYKNNDLNGGGPFFNIEYDGLTTVFTAQALGLDPEKTYEILLAIADAGDYILDSAVFIQSGTFSDQPTAVPEPATMILLGLGLAAAAGLGRRRFKN